MTKIKQIIAREILDSRSNPTVETKVILDNNLEAIASVPSGSSIGSFEAVEIRDNDPNRYHGMGVLKAILNVNQIIAPKLTGKDCTYQKNIDEIMIVSDPTPNKATLGSNAILSVSIAIAKAGALTQKVPLYVYLNNLLKQYGSDVQEIIPTPIFNIINGGKHGSGNLDFQEFQVIPGSYKNFAEQLRIGSEIYHTLKKVLKYRNAIDCVGDEGGFAPNLFTNQDALAIIMDAVRESYYKLGQSVFLGMDVAASYFKKQGKYQIKDKASGLDADDFITFYQELNNEYHLMLLEDPLAEDDWKAWSDLTAKMKDNTIIIGDDLIATNLNRLNKAIEEKAVTGLVVKPNQIGTLSETLKVVQRAKEVNLKIVLAHRSGETCDTFIADLGVAIAADYVKFGAPARGERVAKYNRLLEIEEELVNLPK